jgi:hypothetical protein
MEKVRPSDSSAADVFPDLGNGGRFSLPSDAKEIQIRPIVNSGED